ncbi:MAG TPA: NirA family protein [Rhodopila sp.]|uniref:NirA family protein n=1 Tax=Rhodopila sp. TaxID=2480087 RepID=UPI002B6DE183|nr:NirA family protein [Rhodopila sp.]HVY13823.1 NirA family protein [Rhodopila sp.]
MSGPFSTEQQEYLKGFMFGVEARRAAAGLPLAPGGGEASDPNDLQRAAQDRTVAAGGKLVAEEEAKRKKPPLLRFDEIAAMAQEGAFPKGTDVFLTKYFGLFYVAPTQNAYMCRLRIPGGILTAHQMRGVADIADDLAGGFADITTRANLQLREIPASAPPEIVIRLSEIGLTSRGSGADNIRNVTGSPTAGIDPHELLDTRPHTRAMHHFILHHPELYGLPRKFNIAYDGGGAVAVLEDTNDIAFTAVQVADGFGVPPGVYYRLGLGGITGHKDFARETGVIVAPDETIPLANAILRVFIAEGNRTDRTKARLKYVLDRIGIPAYLDKVEAELGRPLTRVDAAAIQPRPVQDRIGHIGVHKQKQEGRSYIGVVFPVGRVTSERMRGLAAIADRYGSAQVRLTVWQNLLVPDIAEADIPAACAAIEALGLDWKASHLRAGLVACTGNAGCKFSASNTKKHATDLVEFLEPRITVDAPVNIHLTGCHHSCAQHYISDFGLLAAKVEQGEDMVEGYDLHVGGGAGAHQAIGRLIRPGVVFEDLPPMILALLREWMRSREPNESFQDWSAARDDATLLALTDAAHAEAA